MKSITRNFWLDFSLVVTLAFTAFTGLLLRPANAHQISAALSDNLHFWQTAHICGGLVTTTGSLIHVIWHRKWFQAMRRRPAAGLPSKLRANRVVDRWIWITFLVTCAFGALDYWLPSLNIYVFLLGRLHVAFGMAWLIGITIHLALNRKWIVSAARRHLRFEIGAGTGLHEILGAKCRGLASIRIKSLPGALYTRPRVDIPVAKVSR